MENNVNKAVCDEKMRSIEDKLSMILANTKEIKEKILIIPLLVERISHLEEWKKEVDVIPLVCARVTQLEAWKNGFWKTVIATMVGAIAIFSGVVAILNRFRL